MRFTRGPWASRRATGQATRWSRSRRHLDRGKATQELLRAVAEEVMLFAEGGYAPTVTPGMTPPG